jgi:peptidoglycan/xylan/chitin deacetylase (PgdA/CDA1 family)
LRADYKRFAPVAAIGLVLIAVLIVLVAGGDDKSTEAETAAKTSAPTEPATKKPAPTSATGAHDDPVPILMYHVTKTAPAGTPFPELWVSKDDFSGQMDWLADNGYTGITMDQLFKYWDEGFELPDKPVVISFDDGYPSHDKVARPILRKHKWPGVLFLKYGNIGDPESGLTTKNVNNLIAAGWEIESHTIDHSDLTAIGAESLEREVAESKRLIEKRFKVEVEHFCYPAGKYNDTVIEAVEGAGYKSATTVLDGLATPDNPFELKRVRIDGGDGVDGFAAKMRQAQQ